MSDLKESMQKLQMEANQLLLRSGYERSLVRYHVMCADDIDSQIDGLAKKIRNLETQMPKEKKDEPKEGNAGPIEGPLGNPEE